VEFCAKQKEPALVVARNRAYNWKSAGICFRSRTDNVFVELKTLLEPFGIKKFYTDGWGAYERKLNPNQHQVGKANTQKIERKHLTLRTGLKRLARRTICFSKSEVMHDVVIGLYINRYEFGLVVSSLINISKTLSAQQVVTIGGSYFSYYPQTI
jgi:insertion element IS1 protein InsB